MITKVVDALPPVTAAEHQRLLGAPRTSELHREILSDIPAMNAVQVGGKARCETLPSKFTVAAWNVERCLFPEETAAHLAPIAPDIVLVSEVDHGMARTGRRHTTEAMAAALGMTYAFGVEFHELDLGGPTEPLIAPMILTHWAGTVTPCCPQLPSSGSLCSGWTITTIGLPPVPEPSTLSNHA